MHLRFHGRSCARAACLVLLAALAAGCGTQPAKVSATLPDAFSPPVRHPDFSSALPPASIERRLRASRCGKGDGDVTGLAFAGLTTQPGAGGVYLDTGRAPDGTSWFLHRSSDDHDSTYCGVALVGAGTGTSISLTGVRFADREAAKAALESGDFFCTCRQLAK
jgi:hypothetical protein